jgi:tetratricopeptide (TPR) repeat protein/outer membrane protein OmpA-like peptidoglycan-associated protein
MKFKFALFILLFSLGNIAFTQTEKQFLKAGDEAFENGEYYEAIAYLSDALKFNKNPDAHYKIAMSFYNLKEYNKALPYFEKIENSEAFHLLFFYKAANQKLLGNYRDAIASFEAFLEAYPIPGFFRDKAIQEIASCYWAQDQDANAEVKIEHFDKPLNTGYSDFGANYLSSELIQLSSLQSITRNLKSDFQSKIYFYEVSDKKISKSEALEFPFTEDDSLDYANGYFLKEKNQFYYTQCYTEHELGEKICDIYVRELKNNTWGEAKALNLNTVHFTETQPQVFVNKQGVTEIYFVSDRKGGQGKLDIWKAEEITSGQFSEAQNLPAPINTIDNESTPFFDLSSNTLFFSSEWHYGFGGYDIFKSEENNGTWTTPKNLGAPVNSSANDQYYYPSMQGKALFASNRKDALQLKGAACCYDIFAHVLAVNKATIDSSLLALEELSRTDHKENKIGNAFANLQQAIPVTVYFHNDEPNPKSMATKTSLTYADAFTDYQKVKPLYFETFENDNTITNWFTTVDESYDYLNRFLSILSNVLPKQQVTLEIQGYCSPLAVNVYNINLAKRRIVSLQNYVLSWNAGVLQSYFNKGQLKFTTVPFGEEKAKATVSDSYENVKQSIYNPNAALERRVAIIAVF